MRKEAKTVNVISLLLDAKTDFMQKFANSCEKIEANI